MRNIAAMRNKYQGAYIISSFLSLRVSAKFGEIDA